MAQPETHVDRPRGPGGGGGENWQLIETAPKDGRDILAAILVNGRQLVVRWRADAAGGGAWIATDSEREFSPTHWTELPKPPGTAVAEPLAQDEA